MGEDVIGRHQRRRAADPDQPHGDVQVPRRLRQRKDRRPARAAHLARTLTVGLQRAARTSSQVLLYGSTLLFAGIFTGLIHVNISLLPPSALWALAAWCLMVLAFLGLSVGSVCARLMLALARGGRGLARRAWDASRV